MPARRRRLCRLHLAEAVQRPRRRLPQLRSPGDRPGRQHRRQPRRASAWTIDTAAPDTQITGHPADPSSSANASFAFSGSDGGSGVASFQCRRDSSSAADWEACSSERPTPPSPTAPTASKCGRSTRPATSTPPRRASPGRSTPPRPTPRSPATRPSARAPPTPPSASRAATAARASPRSNAGSTAGAFAACTSPKQYSGLADGSHSFEVRANDQAGNLDASPASFAWTIDTAAPDTQLADPPGQPDEQHRRLLQLLGQRRRLGRRLVRMPTRLPAPWPPAPRRRNTAASPTAPTASKSGRRIRPGTSTPAPASFTWTIDTTAPDTQIDCRIRPSPTHSTGASFSFSGSDGGSGVASFQCRLDAGAFAACTSPKQYSGLADGSHNFEVRANRPGRQPRRHPGELHLDDRHHRPRHPDRPDHPADLTNSASAVVQLLGQRRRLGRRLVRMPARRRLLCRLHLAEAVQRPRRGKPQIRSPGQGPGRQPRRHARRASPGRSTPTLPTVTIDSVSKSIVAAGETHRSQLARLRGRRFHLRLGGADCSHGEVIESGSYSGAPAQHTSSLTAGDLNEGPNVIRVCFTDISGNPGADSTTVTKDTAAPDTQLLTHPASPTNSTGATFSFSGSDGGSGVASFQCRLDDRLPWPPAPRRSSYSGLADGSHSFEVRAMDQAGNLDATPASFTWTIDTAAPDTQITGHPADPSSSANAGFAFSGSDGGSGVASFQCRRDSSKPPIGRPAARRKDLPRPRRRLPQLRSPGGRPGRQHRRDPGELQLDDRHRAPPTPRSTRPPGRLSSSAAPRFGFSGSDTAARASPRFQCRLDAGAFAACTSPKQLQRPRRRLPQLRSPGDGQAGNLDATPASFTWTIDTAAPDTSDRLRTRRARRTATGASFSFSGSDGGSGVASFECRLDARRLRRLRIAEGIRRPRRRLPQLRSPGGRPGRQRRRRPPRASPGRSTPPPPTPRSPATRRISPTRSPHSFEFTGSFSVASFECRLDAGAFAALRLAEGNTAASPTALTRSKSGESTPTAVSIPPRLRSPGPSTPSRR